MTKYFLYADDDPDDIDLFKDAAIETGLPIKVKSAKNCTEVLTAHKKEPMPDLIIIDGRMPYMSVLEFITSIRLTTELQNLPLIVMSGLLTKDTIEVCYKAGMNLFLLKPTEFAAFVDILKKLYNFNWTATPVINSQQFFNS